MALERAPNSFDAWIEPLVRFAMPPSDHRLSRPQPSPNLPIAAVGPAPRSRPPDTDATLLTLLYETVGNPDGWTAFVDALGASYGNGMATLFLHDYAQRCSSVFAGTSGRSDYLVSYDKHYFRVNPWISGVELRPVGQVSATEAVVPFPQFLKTEFYTDWCRPQGIGAGIGVTVQRDGRRMMAISVLFPRAVLEQGPEASVRLQRLVPHLLQAARLHRQFAELETCILAGEKAFYAMGTAMMLVGAAGQVVHLNQAAEQLTAFGDGLTVVRNEIKTAVSAEEKNLRGLISTALQIPRTMSAQPGGVMRISRPSGRMAYEVLVAPVSGSVLTVGFSGSAAAVFIRDPDRRVPTPVAQLPSAYTISRELKPG